VLHVVLRCALAAVLLVAAVAKIARRDESRAALTALVAAPTGIVARVLFPAVVAAEIALAAGVALGSDVAALLAAAFMAASALVLARALRAGRGGAPCGCFGARSRVSRLAVARAAALAVAFALLPLVPRDDLSADAWLTIGLVTALALVAAMAVALFALARVVGLLRLAIGPQSALEIPDEGPPLGAESGLGAFFDPRPGADLGLAVFTSEGCHLCQALAPAVAALGRDPHVSLAELDEVRDHEHWERLGIPGSPYALVLDRRRSVVAKGTFNSLGQLESLLAGAERRMREPTHA
jgi:hypothetical protein